MLIAILLISISASAQSASELLQRAYAQRGITITVPSFTIDANADALRRVESVRWDPLRSTSVIVFARLAGNPIIALSPERLPALSSRTEATVRPVLIRSGERCTVVSDEQLLSMHLTGVALQTAREGERLQVRIDASHVVHAVASAPAIAKVAP